MQPGAAGRYPFLGNRLYIEQKIAPFFDYDIIVMIYINPGKE